MRILLLSSLIIISFTSQGSLKDSIWGLIDSVKEKIGLSDPSPSISLPQIPQPDNNPTDLAVYKRDLDQLYPGNQEMKGWSTQKKKQMNIGFINEVFEVVQSRTPSKGEVLKWYNILDQGSSREGVYRALTVDDYYRGLESRVASLSDQAVDFTNDYLKKYLQQKASNHLLKRMTVYSLKRVITDSTLKTLEVLSGKPQDLFAWYAVFSEDIAIQFPSVWSYSLRSNKSREVHYQWAQKSAYQLILSEVMIKLHKVYNYLGRVN